MVAATITGTSGKPPAAAVAVALALVAEVDKHFPVCPTCTSDLTPGQECVYCARQAEREELAKQHGVLGKAL